MSCESDRRIVTGKAYMYPTVDVQAVMRFSKSCLQALKTRFSRNETNVMLHNVQLLHRTDQ